MGMSSGGGSPLRAHLGRVLPALRRLLADPVTAGAAEDAGEDGLHVVTDNADDPLGVHPGGAR